VSIIHYNAGGGNIHFNEVEVEVKENKKKIKKKRFNI
jgi:hypothetical protein